MRLPYCAWSRPRTVPADTAPLLGADTSLLVTRNVLGNARTTRVIERLDTVLAASANAIARGSIVIIEATRHRIRYLPIGE